MRELPVAVIGAGPVGLAAAAHLIDRGIAVKVYEAGDAVAANMRDWGHVRLFSPWRYNIDPAARLLLKQAGWQEPDAEAYPTGADLVTDYLDPMSKTPELASAIELRACVTAIGRRGIDKAASRDRALHPFVLTITDREGNSRRDLASAVIDASGTWTSPNPLGSDGFPAHGETTFADRIAYGIPDVLGHKRSDYGGRTTLVLGAGHSAANVLLDLQTLADQDPATTAIWVTRGKDLSRVYGGGENDQLAGRGDLGHRLRQEIETGRITLISGFAVKAISEENGRLHVEGHVAGGTRILGPVDRIVACTGQRPDLALTRELRVELDTWLESVKALGPMIDPNLHSCGTVPPHGHRELSHPEPGFYTVGIKSYGRAPTFLMLTGYEQVRSVVAAIAGDMAAADDVRLVLPETGVCSAAPSTASGCCDGPAPIEMASCCAADAVAKASGQAGCGCAAEPPEPAPVASACCGSPA
ncbi:MAG: NAD(P)-binding protein [Bosea sp. (in: a-proteobacteria)]|nr:NAD(P)-binding protein [Bosea sp. (in: a-proteobacteria)]